MLKRKIDNYIRHYYGTTRNALLVTGARQIGKTYSIREFGKTFKSFIEINFIEFPEAVVFNNDNLKVSGKIIYAPVYMVMFLERKNIAPDFYKVDLSGLLSLA